MARPKTFATCDYCGCNGLAWGRLRNTRFGEPGAYDKPWAWILYASRRDASGAIIAQADGRAEPDLSLTHTCDQYAPIRRWKVGETSTRPAHMRDRKERTRRPPTPVQATDPQAQAQAEHDTTYPPDPDPEPDTEPDDMPNHPDDMPEHTDQPKAPHTAPPRAAGELFAQAIQLVTEQASRAVDRETVEKIVAEQIAAALADHPRTETLTVETRRPDGTVIHTAEIAHPNLPRLLRYVQARRHVYLYGPAGSSKTCSAIQAAQLAGLRHCVIPLCQTTTVSQLFGFVDAQSHYRPTLLREFYEHGGEVILDEFDNSAGNVAATLNGLLENGSGSFPDGMVARHPDFVVIATGNTNLRGATRDHSSRTSLDLATVARFAFIEWPYAEYMEEGIVRRVSARNTAAILAWVRAVRQTLTAERVAMTLAGPREALNLARDLEQGETFADAAETWVWRGLEPATRDRILARHPYPQTIERGKAA